MISTVLMVFFCFIFGLFCAEFHVQGCTKIPTVPLTILIFLMVSVYGLGLAAELTIYSIDTDRAKEIETVIKDYGVSKINDKVIEITIVDKQGTTHILKAENPEKNSEKE